MQEIRQSRREVEQNFAALVAEVKCEVKAAQEKTSEEVAKTLEGARAPI